MCIAVTRREATGQQRLHLSGVAGPVQQRAALAVPGLQFTWVHGYLERVTERTAVSISGIALRALALEVMQKMSQPRSPLQTM